VQIARASLFIALVCSLTTIGSAQNPAPASNPPDNPPAKATTPDHNKATDKASSTGADSKDRLFYALPNFMTLENGEHVPPLTTGQKFKLVARSSFDPVQPIWYGALAGISQAEDSEPGYGQGAEGYAKRFGATYADGAIENFMTGAVFASVLHQDPRFYVSTKGSFAHRTGYAISRIFITRSDAGTSQFNCSEICGSAAAAAISTYSYHPSEDKTFSNTISVWGSQVGYDTITIVIKEFWPDIRRKLHKSKDIQPQQ
jgi:hypothetical protein